MEKCFQQEGIPYIVSGREEFLEDPLIQGSISFFCSLAEPDNPYYKKDALKKLWDLEENEISGSIYEELKAKYRDRWKREKPQKFMQSWIKDLEQEGNPKLQNLADMAIFIRISERFWMRFFWEKGDLKRCGGKNISGDAVSLMTLHASKGLEFPVVFMFGMEKGEIPLEREENPADIQEERRLFYVGMTRAREELFLTCTQEPSSFLDEIPETYTQRKTVGKQKRYRPMNSSVCLIWRLRNNIFSENRYEILAERENRMDLKEFFQQNPRAALGFPVEWILLFCLPWQ